MLAGDTFFFRVTVAASLFFFIANIHFHFFNEYPGKYVNERQR